MVTSRTGNFVLNLFDSKVSLYYGHFRPQFLPLSYLLADIYYERVISFVRVYISDLILKASRGVIGAFLSAAADSRAVFYFQVSAGRDELRERIEEEALTR